MYFNNGEHSGLDDSAMGCRFLKGGNKMAGYISIATRIDDTFKCRFTKDMIIFSDDENPYLFTMYTKDPSHFVTEVNRAWQDFNDKDTEDLG